MKANEAPEKLYLHPTAKGEVGASWLTFPLTNEDIEYTRTDVLLDKLECWMNENFYQYAGEFAEGILARFDRTENCIEDFKKYIEDPCDGCTNRKGCVTCENGELRETVQKEPVSDELETSIVEYMNHVPENEPESSNTLYTYEQMQDIARHFANWHKQQMMKDAEEAEITSKPNDYGEYMPRVIVPVSCSYKEGEKVKVIIIKEG